jgi:hypothetical protein
MGFNEIEYKKPFFSISNELNEYLINCSRCLEIPLQYEDLLRFTNLVPLQDKKGDNSLWKAAIYSPNDLDFLYAGLVEMYRLLMSDGSKIDHLIVNSIDYCSYGNSKPFRIKILNQLNDNYDYYYIKRADASRVYGLELEHYFSPNKIHYICYKNTIVEEHIIGVPGDQFIKEFAPNQVRDKKKEVNLVRLAKEFVKFNERCFVRLLGDMRAYNFVVVVTQDFDQIQYRIRAIDFDQQCFEGRHKIYLPQFYKDNIFFVQLAQNSVSSETAEQYVKEEQSLLRKRYLNEKNEIDTLINILKNDTVSFPEYVKNLKMELGEFYKNTNFKDCENMGEILEVNIKTRLQL